MSEQNSFTKASRRRDSCDLEIIVPAFNEESRLPWTLKVVANHLSSLSHLSCRIIVVDNGSCDRTADIVDRYLRTATIPAMVIGCSTGGKGAAVARGMMTSSASHVGFLDADLAVPAEEISSALQRLDAGADVVIASRRCAGASFEKRQPPVRRAGSWAFRRAIRDLIPDIADTQCGFKFFTREAAHRLFAQLETAGFSFDVEILVRAAAAGYTIEEMPVSWRDGAASTFSAARHGPGILRDVVRLRRIAIEINGHELSTDPQLISA